MFGNTHFMPLTDITITQQFQLQVQFYNIDLNGGMNGELFKRVRNKSINL